MADDERPDSNDELDRLADDARHPMGRVDIAAASKPAASKADEESDEWLDERSGPS
jgi:hypothetical protein